MFAEFAFDPSLLNSEASVRYWTASFGFDHGRLIFEFPKAWTNDVYKTLNSRLPHMEVKRIVAIIEKLDLLPFRPSTKWEGACWLENAIREQRSSRAFRAVISTENRDGQDFILTESDTHPVSPHNKWTVPNSKKLRRDGSAMAEAISPLLRMSNRVVFVDPYFSPADEDFTNALTAFLLKMIAPNGKWLAEEITYITGDNKKKEDHGLFRQQCDKLLPKCIPLGMEVNFVLCNRREIHDRYVITKRGSVSFGQGLDDCGPKEEIQHVRAIRLDHQTTEELLQEYAGHPGKPAKFKRLCEVKVTGTKSVPKQF